LCRRYKEKSTVPKHQIDCQGQSQKKLPRTNKTQSETKLPEETKSPEKEKLIPLKKATPKKLKSPSEKKHIRLTEKALKKQVAELTKQILRYRKKSPKKTRIKYVNSVSGHRDVAAQYVKDWERKIVCAMHLNYPESAKSKKPLRLAMSVGINTDGSIYSIRIDRTSGIQLVDAAMKRSVRQSAPFPALPKVLLEEFDVLMIKSFWTFWDESF
jgi:protein TonB